MRGRDGNALLAPLKAIILYFFTQISCGLVKIWEEENTMAYDITHICLAIERNIFITHLQIDPF